MQRASWVFNTVKCGAHPCECRGVTYVSGVETNEGAVAQSPPARRGQSQDLVGASLDTPQLTGRAGGPGEGQGAVGPSLHPSPSPPAPRVKDPLASGDDCDHIRFFSFSLIEGYISLVMDVQTQQR